MPKVDRLSESTVKDILGNVLFDVWTNLKGVIASQYDMTEEWYSADKGNAYELKYRRGGKTLISIFPNFPKNNTIGVMIIFGKAEREKFESNVSFSNYVINTYNEAKVYHDGKWVMFSLPNKELEKDLLEMLAIKRKPNRN